MLVLVLVLVIVIVIVLAKSKLFLCEQSILWLNQGFLCNKQDDLYVFDYEYEHEHERGN